MLRNTVVAASAQIARALRPCVALGLLACPLLATAGDLTFKLEPGVALPLSAPQSDLYGVGGGETLKALFGLNRYLDIGPTASFLFLSSSSPLAESGVAWGLGGGLRVKLPHDSDDHHGFALSPWADVDLLYVRTGSLNRPGFDAAVGVSMPLGESRGWWVGPFVRYFQVIQPSRDGYDNRDAKVLTLGLSFEVGGGRERKPTPAEVRVVEHEVNACPDRDQDGLPDNVDHCPAVAGPIDNWGCRLYKRIVVKKDKLELKEKIYFAWDQATLEDISFPVLDEVAQALADNPSSRVQVEGHTDSSGADDHNQSLSERRAQAVVDYLVAHGVSRDRLVAKGFSSSVPVATNETEGGREANRRVEFVVYFHLLNSGSTK